MVNVISGVYYNLPVYAIDPATGIYTESLDGQLPPTLAEVSYTFHFIQMIFFTFFFQIYFFLFSYFSSKFSSTLKINART